MEKIKWVTTPKCCDCNEPWTLKRRYCCMGCERIHLLPEVNHKRNPKERKEIKEAAENLRRQGYSISEIALKLKIPRATAQRAAAAVKKGYEKQEEGKIISLSSIRAQTCLFRQS